LKANIQFYQQDMDVKELELKEHTCKWFDKGYWYGDCVLNERIAKNLNNEIKYSKKARSQWEKYYKLYEKEIGII